MFLSPVAFNRHIRHMGQMVSWRRSYQCPCINEFSGAAEASCPLCNGKGYQWSATAVPGVVGVTSQVNKKQWAQFGNWEDGDMLLTVGSDSPVYDISRFDRLLLLNSTDRFSRVLVRGDDVEKINVPVVSIDRVFWLNQAKNAVIEGDVPTVADDGSIVWGSNSPDPGTQYSITGTCYTEYYVYDMMPSDRNEHSGLLLPRKCQLKNFDLFGR